MYEERVLIHIPIIHTQADMGTLRVDKNNHEAINHIWKVIEDTVLSFDLPFQKVRLYQDGLAVSGQEKNIVKEVAAQGSRNYKLLLRLMRNGAILMGTESPDLLQEEYQLAKQMQNTSDVEPADDHQAKHKHAQSLLEQRDQFISDRINTTLRPGETGLLFLGMLHSIDAWLASDIRIIRPIQLSLE